MSLPSFEVGLPAYYVLATSEASSNLARYDGIRYGGRPDARVRLAKIFTEVVAHSNEIDMYLYATFLLPFRCILAPQKFIEAFW